VICTLGNFATKLLREDPTGITRLHGRDEVRVVGARAVRLMPLFHPAAALYTPSNVEVLRADFARIPELLAMGPPAQPAQPAGATARAEELAAGTDEPAAGAAVEEPVVEGAATGEEPAAAAEPAAGEPEPAGEPERELVAAQLGLFD
jgi:DNA polymerase